MPIIAVTVLVSVFPMCNIKNQQFVEHAIKMAKKSTMEHKHGAVIVLHNEIIATGYNYRQYYRCHGFSVHAEVDALTKVKNRKNMLSEAEMYVVRISRFNPTCPNEFCIKMSKPCRECSKAIMKYGIRRVYYSTTDEVDSDDGSRSSQNEYE